MNNTVPQSCLLTPHGRMSRYGLRELWFRSLDRVQKKEKKVTHHLVASVVITRRSVWNIQTVENMNIFHIWEMEIPRGKLHQHSKTNFFVFASWKTDSEPAPPPPPLPHIHKDWPLNKDPLLIEILKVKTHLLAPQGCRSEFPRWQNQKGTYNSRRSMLEIILNVRI